MEEEKKTKLKSVRFFEEDLDKITDLATELGVTQADLISEWRRSYERLRQEETDRQGQNLKTLRDYTNKIIDLFAAVSGSTEETVKSEQGKAIEAERRYEDQVIKTNEIKKEFETKFKDQEKELKRITKELEKYEAFEENVEGRINDKVEIIRSKDESIIALTEEMKELKAVNKELREFEKKEILLKNDIETLKDEMKQTDLDHQKKLLDVREELQNKFSEKIQTIYAEESEKREKVRNELENRLREEHRQEITRMRDEQKQEIERIRKECEKRMENQEQKHNQEIQQIQDKK